MERLRRTAPRNTSGVSRTASMADRRAGTRVGTQNTSNVAPVSFARQEAQTTSAGGRPYTPPAPYTPPTPAPMPVFNPTPVAETFSQQLDYGQPTPATPAPTPVADTSEETLKKTAEYMARERAIQNELDRFIQDQATERTGFEEKLGQSLTELGYDPTKGTFDLGELLAQGQRATVSGRAYDALRNDFAARGMLQSGAYQARRGVLDADLLGRKKAIEDTRIDFGKQQQGALSDRNTQAETARRTALEEAKQAVLNRFATGG